jgi:hypothetical protein
MVYRINFKVSFNKLAKWAVYGDSSVFDTDHSDWQDEVSGPISKKRQKDLLLSTQHCGWYT